MDARTLIAGVSAAAALLAGCSAGTVALRPETANSIQKVALLTVAEPVAYVANDFGSPGAMPGGIGGAVAGISSANAGKGLQPIIEESGFTAGEQTTRSMQEEPTAAGYNVTLVSVSREEPGKLLESYDGIDVAGADAFLDVAIESMAYATGHPLLSPYWRPASVVHVALVDSRTHEKLYSEKFMYGYHNPFMSGTDLDAPDNFHFKNRESLFADSTRLVSGMQDSVSAVSRQVAGNLSRQVRHQP